VAFVAFAATNVAFGLWSWLLKRHPAAIVAPFSLLVPLWGVSSSILVFGERLSLAKAIGCLLIVAGVAANSWPARRLRPITPP
jgi:O-acetylserine/cysteine efflux transporter